MASFPAKPQASTKQGRLAQNVRPLSQLCSFFDCSAASVLRTWRRRLHYPSKLMRRCDVHQRCLHAFCSCAVWLGSAAAV